MQEKTNVAVRVNSCDKYEDAWNPFFKLFSIMWPDCPYDIYLNSTNFEYGNYNIFIIYQAKDIRIDYIPGVIPFLYTDQC